MDEQLVRACEIVAYKDAQPLRRAMFDALAARRRDVRLALAAWERLGFVRARTAFVTARALSSHLGVRFPRELADLLAVCQYDNERRQIARLRALVPELAIADITCEPALGRLSLSELRPALALIEEYAAEGDFLIAARVAETVGYYLRMRRELEASAAQGVIVSSDTNPYAVALVYAAKRVGKRTCFVAHGHVAEGPPPLDFDLALIDGPAVRDVYERAGPIRAEVVFRGSEGVPAPMHPSRGVKAVGIVLSILVDWRAVGDWLARVRQELAPERIVLRLHPNEQMREPRWADGFDLSGVSVSLGERSLVDEARACDLVLAANTSAHLTVLKAGVPSAYIAGLDRLGNDYYGFVRDGIVANTSDRIDPQAIADFYLQPQWVERFARYDAGYPDRQASCDRAVARALRTLVGRGEASA